MTEIIFPQEVIKNIHKPNYIMYMYYEGDYWKRLFCSDSKYCGFHKVDQDYSSYIIDNLFMCDVKFFVVIDNNIFANKISKTQLNKLLGAEFKL